MLNETLGTWAAKTRGIKKAYTMVSDYGPGHDAEGAFHLGFKAGGGEIVGSVRFPVDSQPAAMRVPTDVPPGFSSAISRSPGGKTVLFGNWDAVRWA